MNGIDLNHKNQDGQSPLIWAAANNSCEVLKFIIFDMQESPNFASLLDQSTTKLYTPVHYAAATGSLEALKILIENGANYNLENDKGKTPLDEAFSRLQRSTYNFLKDLGAEQGTLYKSIPE